MREVPHPKKPETAPYQERIIGGVKYRTDKIGALHLYDLWTEEEISISVEEMNAQDRIDFFSAISEVLQDSLPKGTQILREFNEILIVPKDYIKGDKPLGMIRGSHTDDGGLVIKWIGSEVKNGGTILLAELLKQYPDTEYIYGELEATNYAVYNDLRKIGNTHEDALRQTPAYKTRAACGFNEIKPQEEERGKRGRPILVTVPCTIKGGKNQSERNIA